MIRINLLAGPPGGTATHEWVPREQRAALLGLVLLAIVAIGAGAWWYALGAINARLSTQIVEAETRLAELKTAAAVVEQTHKRKIALAERLAVIDDVQGAIRVPVSLLETISRSVPDGLWLLHFKQTGASVEVEGRALSLTAVTDFAGRLQASNFIQHPVDILTTTAETFEQSTVLRFIVRATTNSTTDTERRRG